MAGQEHNRNDRLSELSAYSAPGREIVALDDIAWKQFSEALERPAREIPEVVELFRAKAPWD